MRARSGSLDHFYGVILAGGRGTRFWPLSRSRHPKQFLHIVGKGSLLEQTVERLRPLIPPQRIWILTNELVRRKVVEQLGDVPRRQVIAEPVQRNTAPAIALAARLLHEQDPEAVMGVFPSDHVVGKVDAFHSVLRRTIQPAKDGKLVVLGIRPKWAETGYGYIEFPPGARRGGRKAEPVVRFREKPRPATARRFVNAGHFYWNSGMFVWQARTIRQQVERFLPATAAALSKIRPLGARQWSRSLREHYPDCDNISIDYGVLERANNIVGFACGEFGWNDVGSWQALHQLLVKHRRGNVVRSRARLLSADGNYVDAPAKLAALIGVRDLIVVDTPDVLLICRHRDAQRVADLVKDLEQDGLTEFL